LQGSGFGREAKLLTAREMFMPAGRASAIAAWLAENEEPNEASMVHVCADTIIGSVERMRRSGAQETAWRADDR